MPDLVTHIAFSHLVRRPFEIKQSGKSHLPFRILLYLGTILPDITTRSLYIVFPSTHDWTYPLHTPVGALVLCGIIALLFESSLRKKAFANLSTGAGLHFVLDSFQKQLIGGYPWLFPFSWKPIGIGLLWSDDILQYFPVWIAVVVIVEIGIFIAKKRRTHSKSR
ncbi:MAG: metal-dependent hydrolase [bacterium]